MTLFCRYHKAILLTATLLILLLIAPRLLSYLGHSLIRYNAELERADAAVVLSTGIGYSPRLMQAAEIYNRGLVNHIVINGNRKTDFIRSLEARGFNAPSPWHENSVAMLEFFGVPKERVIIINAEDAYDTISEAAITGTQLAQHSIQSVIVTTSKFHTRRAGYIWQQQYHGQLKIQMAAADEDPFDPDRWWHSGRQIRQLLAEYGAWLYYWGKSSPEQPSEKSKEH
ncbi:MAG: YdcF family protein [Candidatus Sedimenticola sp. (ex Thyasira tokunagai)]